MSSPKLIELLKDAHKTATQARSKIVDAQLASQKPNELVSLLPLLEIAEFNLTAACEQIAIVVGALTEEPHDKSHQSEIA